MKLVPTDYAIVLARTAKELGEDLLESSAMTLTELEAREFMPLPAYVELLAHYTSLQEDPAWGFQLGQQFSMASHGALGFGAISAPTLRDGLVFLARYIPTRASYTTATVEQHGRSLHVLFRHDEIMLPFQQRICETLSMIFQSFIESAGAAATPLVWRFPYPQPENYKVYGQWLHGGFTFDALVLRLEVPDSVAMLPSAFRNDAAYRATQAQCEALLVETSTDTLVQKVQAILASHIDLRVMESTPVTEIPMAEEIADRLGVSRRTLIRQLKKSGTTFQALKDDLMRNHVEQLLVRSDLPLAEIGERLGYSDAANFTRACKRMFDATPTTLRKRLLAVE